MADLPESDGAVPATRCGFIAILGAPNVGKSTLLNRLVGAKVSIVSPKVQTTRTRVLGIVLRGDAQIVFIDTPGIFTPRRRLDRAMVGAAWGGASDADAVLLLVDSARGIDADTRAILDRMKAGGRRALVALNKVDLVPKPRLLDLAAQLDGEGLFDAVYMISAETGDGVDRLVDDLAARLHPGPWMFPEDQISDMPMRLLAAEITREKLYLQLHKELPYAATVVTESWTERKDGSVAIEQTIYVRRDSQRAIVLGHRGARIKGIGAAARLELEEMLEKRIHLFLFVKVREKWEEDRAHYRDWGLDFDAEAPRRDSLRRRHALGSRAMSTHDSDLDSAAASYDHAPHAVGADIIIGAFLAARMPLAETWILDAGCGGGGYSRAVVEHVGHIDAIDPSEANVARARERLWRYERAGRVALHHGDLQNLPFDDGMFDAVMANQALYRVEEGAEDYPGHRRALAEFHRVLRPGGVLVVNATTHRQIRNGFWFHALLPEAMETALRVCAPGRRLVEMIGEAGFAFRGRTVPLDLLVGGGQGEGRWLTEPPLHRMEPFWAHASEAAVDAALGHIARMMEAGRMASFIAENDDGRYRFGQFTFFVAHKPDSPLR